MSVVEPGLQRATILVVDDTPQNVELLDELLRGSYRVRVALSGEKALASVAREVPDLILLDVMMPGLDGYEVCRRLKQDPVMRRVPIVFITAKNEVADEQQGFDLGAVDYITKPISPPIVLARVRAQLALYSQRRALEIEVQSRTDDLARANSTLQQVATQRQKALERAEYLFNYDPVTSLPNRRQFLERLGRSVELARQAGEHLALAGFSLDRFNVVKNTLGSAVCDQLLVETTQRLQRRLRSTDILARTGGEEFAVLLASGHNFPEALIEEVDKLTAVTLVELAQPFKLPGGKADVTASGSFALFPADGDSALELMRRMEVTLEHVKLNGGNHAERYDSKVDSGASAIYVMEGRLREVLRIGALVPYYQPKVDPRTGRVVGAETLVRWPLADGSMVGPCEFIPIAERCGLIDAVDHHVLQETCKQLALWKDRRDFRVAVNLSASAFQSLHLVEDLRAVLERTGAPPEMLELEITEYALITDVNIAIEKLKAVRDLGVRIALDDFGTGYSSMSYLRRLPLDVLKVDQSFVCDIERDRNAAAIVKAIVTMAGALDLHVVAEGVETLGQLEFIREYGGNALVQGWVYSPAVPAAQMAEIMAKGTLEPLRPARSA